MHRGYVKLWRKISDNEVLSNASACQLLLLLMVKSTHKPHKIIVGTQVVNLEQGQFFTGRKWLANELKSSEQKIRTALKLLEKCGIINQRSTSSGTIISLINWDKYQDDQPTANQQSNQQLTNGQPTTNQQLTTKQEYKEQEEYITTSSRARVDEPDLTKAGASKLLKVVQPIFEAAWPEADKTMFATDVMIMDLIDNLTIDPQRSTPEFWLNYAQLSRASPFLRGEVKGKKGYFPGMKFSLFLKPEYVNRTLNGDFGEPSKSKTPPETKPKKEFPSAIEPI